MEAFSRKPFSGEERFRSQVNPCGIFGRDSSPGTVFFAYFGCFSSQDHSIIAGNALISVLPALYRLTFIT